MTEDNAGERPQKTVAELLAQHGAQVDGGRRRRRRAADDDDEQPAAPGPTSTGGSRRKPEPADTGSQAIIDRVAGDGGTPPPARRTGGSRRAPEAGPPPQPAQQPAQRRPPAHESGHFARPQLPPQPAPQESAKLARPVLPPSPQESGQLPLPPRGRGAPRQPPPAAPGRGPVARPRAIVPPPVAPLSPLASRLDGLDGKADPEIADPPRPAPGGMGSGNFQAPRPPVRRQPARRPMPPKSEDHTEQFAAVVDDVASKADPVDKPPALDAPPAGLASWRKQRNKVAMDDTEIGVMPPVGELDGALLDSSQPTRFVPPPPFAPTRATPPAPPDRGTPAAPDRGRLEDTAFHQGVDDDQDDEYDYDDQVDGYEREFDDVDEELEDDEVENDRVAASPAKQWLALGAQLALGVVGGAAVWLGFNWLWVTLPAAALIAALLVVVALVWIVRKIRRAEDLQTTVLAVLVGLVVTVSPAALLLVSR
jgi:hypothetical protein